MNILKPDLWPQWVIPERPTEEIKKFFQPNQDIISFLEKPETLSLEQIEEIFFDSSKTIEDDKKNVEKSIKREGELPSGDKGRDEEAKERDKVRNRIDMHRYLQEMFLEFFKKRQPEQTITERDVIQFLSRDVEDSELLRGFKNSLVSPGYTGLEGFEKVLFKINGEIIQETQKIKGIKKEEQVVSNQKLPATLEYLQGLRGCVGERWMGAREIELSKRKHEAEKQERK